MPLVADQTSTAENRETDELVQPLHRLFLSSAAKNSNSWLVIFSVVVGTPTTEAHVCQSDQTNESACNSLVIDVLQNTRSIILECTVQYSVIA